MERRRLLGGIAATGAAFAMTPISGPVGNVGVLDIAKVRADARRLRASDFACGSRAEARAAAAQHLEQATSLLTRPVRDSLRPSLHTAVGDLAHTLAFVAFDAHEFDTASSLNRFAFDRVRDSGDWHLWAQILVTEARINVWTGRPQSGLRNLQQALTAPDLTATERAMIHAVEARAHAPTGDHQATLTAIGNADEALASANPTVDPPWVRTYDAATHAGNVGHSLTDLILAGRPGAAPEAGARLAMAMQSLGADQNRSRAFTTTLAAITVMAAGDPAEAVTIGHEALALARTVDSARSRQLLADLAATGRRRHPDRPDVADLSHHIGTSRRQ